MAEWAPWAEKYGHEYGVPPSLLLGDLQQESGGNINVPNSSTGAEGIAQFEPGTWSAYGQGSPYNGPNAIKAQAKYLSVLYKQSNKNWYGALERYSGFTPNYANDVLHNAKYYGGVIPPNLSIPSQYPHRTVAGSSSSNGGGSIGSWLSNIFNLGTPAQPTHQTLKPQGGAIERFIIMIHNTEVSPTGVLHPIDSVEQMLLFVLLFIMIAILFVLGLWLLFGTNSMMPSLPIPMGGE